MPIFRCELCLCETNTAFDTNYWVRGQGMYPPEVDNLALCGLCLPDTYADGSTVNRKYNLERKDGWVKLQKMDEQRLTNFNYQTATTLWALALARIVGTDAKTFPQNRKHKAQFLREWADALESGSDE